MKIPPECRVLIQKIKQKYDFDSKSYTINFYNKNYCVFVYFYLTCTKVYATGPRNNLLLLSKEETEKWADLADEIARYLEGPNHGVTSGFTSSY